MRTNAAAQKRCYASFHARCCYAAQGRQSRINNGFPALSIGLASFIAVLAGLWLKTGRQVILASNSWMQTPQGFRIVDDHVVPVDWWKIIAHTEEAPKDDSHHSEEGHDYLAAVRPGKADMHASWTTRRYDWQQQLRKIRT